MLLLREEWKVAIFGIRPRLANCTPFFRDYRLILACGALLCLALLSLDCDLRSQIPFGAERPKSSGILLQIMVCKNRKR
jgi:hypothetical protein